LTIKGQITTCHGRMWLTSQTLCTTD